MCEELLGVDWCCCCCCGFTSLSCLPWDLWCTADTWRSPADLPICILLWHLDLHGLLCPELHALHLHLHVPWWSECSAASSVPSSPVHPASWPVAGPAPMQQLLWRPGVWSHVAWTDGPCMRTDPHPEWCEHSVGRPRGPPVVRPRHHTPTPVKRDVPGGSHDLGIVIPLVFLHCVAHHAQVDVCRVDRLRRPQPQCIVNTNILTNYTLVESRINQECLILTFKSTIRLWFVKIKFSILH